MRKQKQKHNKTYKGRATKRRQRIIKRLIIPAAIITTAGAITIANLVIAATQKTINWINDPLNQADQIITTINVPTNNSLTVEQRIQNIAKSENFRWPAYLLRLAECESRFDPFAVNNNGRHGVDRGVFQINDKYHPEVSNECAFSVECATRWTMERINAGYQNEWACNSIIK